MSRYTGSHVLTQNSPSMRRIMSEWKQVQADGLAMGEGMMSAKGNSSDTFRLKVRTDGLFRGRAASYPSPFMCVAGSHPCRVYSWLPFTIVRSSPAMPRLFHTGIFRQRIELPQREQSTIFRDNLVVHARALAPNLALTRAALSVLKYALHQEFRCCVL